MTTPRDPDGSTRISQAGGAHTPTASGGDVAGRMTGTAPTAGDRPSALPQKTSAAAVFGLVFGLAALFCALTAILSPAAIVLGIIGIVVAVVGLKMSKRPGVTGHGVAVGGLVTAVLGLLLGGAVLGGLAAVVNSDSALDRITKQINDLRDDVPSPQEVTGTVR